jgi:Domain of unknown function (DUF4129)
MNLIDARNAGRRRLPVYVSYATACGMVICFAAVFIQFLAWFFPTLDIRGMLLVCVLAVVESFFSFWLVKRLPTAQRQMAYYRGTEMVILLVALKFFTELRAGPASFWNNFLLWPVQFPFNILSTQYLLTVSPVLGAWWAGNLFAADLSMLGAEDASNLDDRFKTTSVRAQILRRFLSLGMFVVILAGIPPQTVLETSLPVAPSTIPAVIAYFVLGTILLSLTRYITLETTWWQDKLHIPAQIPRRWFAYSALILAVLVFLISWLPTNYGMGLFETLNALISLLYRLIMTLYGLFLLGLTLIARLLLRKQADSPIAIPQITPQPETPPAAIAAPMYWELIKSVLLWGSLIALVIVALRQYIAFNRDLSEELRRFRPLRWLFSAWDRIKASLGKANKSVGAFVRNSLKRLRNLGPEPAGPGKWDFINPRRLSPRQKVIFYYLALVRRAKEAGMPRQEDQTPYEYARSLTSNLAEEKDDVDKLTESFIEARYSRHEIPAKVARRAENIWETIRHEFKKHSKNAPGGKEG